jgi:hypothetical protein
VLGRKCEGSDVGESTPDKLKKLALKLEDSIVLRVDAILAIVQQAWVEWVFKPSKQSLLMDIDQEQIG